MADVTEEVRRLRRQKSEKLLKMTEEVAEGGLEGKVRQIFSRFYGIIETRYVTEIEEEVLAVVSEADKQIAELKERIFDFGKWLEKTEWRGVSSEMFDEFKERFEGLLTGVNVTERERLEGVVAHIQQLLEEYTPKFIGKMKAGPPSDYQVLWFLTKEFRDKLEEELGK